MANAFVQDTWVYSANLSVTSNAMPIFSNSYTDVTESVWANVYVTPAANTEIDWSQYNTTWSQFQSTTVPGKEPLATYAITGDSTNLGGATQNVQVWKTGI